MIVIGADVGGTSSRVALFRGDVERARAEGRGGPMRAGSGEALAERLAELARPLLLREDGPRADAFVVGASGAGRSAEREELRAALERHRLAWKVIVVGDAELARAAAFSGGAGVLVIAGTGSIAISLDNAGTMRRVGGLGWRMGDQGSAYWLALRALEAVGLMHDSIGPPTRLAERLPAAAKVPGVAALVRWSTTASAADVAALAPTVIACADEGDAVATELRSAALEALAALATAAGAGPMPVALSGGLLAPGRPLRDRLADALEAAGVTVIRKAVDPCRGAIVLAG
ncbi:MAG: BadF/BadG/BcrA/BcrD ATPase family protein [Gemmatimonadales bacterium]